MIRLKFEKRFTFKEIKKIKKLVNKITNENTIINHFDSFYINLKDWKKDQFYFNFNRTHHKNRTLSKEELKEKLDNKILCSKFIISENNWFYSHNFKYDQNKIKEFLIIVFNIFDKMLDIKSRLIFLYFDNSNLKDLKIVFFVSTLKRKYSKDLKREIWSSNYNDVEYLRKLRYEHKTIRGYCEFYKSLRILINEEYIKRYNQLLYTVQGE